MNLMKKLSTLLILFIALLAINMQAQENAFVVDFTGDLSSINLDNASTNSVGSVSPNFRGMDFGPDNVLYGLSWDSNELYEIDTADATITLVGTCTPATDHSWTGLAYDAATGIMYANASYSIAAGSSKLYTIDLTDGSVTLIGTQSTVTYFGAIAIDDTGVLYGLALSANSKIYTIDKTDASVTEIGSVNEFGGAGMGYGMDYNSDNQTMYVTAYDSFSFNNDLYTINLTTGAATQVGALVGWTYALAIVSPFFADFTADATEVCTGTTVNFTDASAGADSWSWSFEGGTPSSSTDQNPSVVYNTPGTYNVELEVTNSAGSTATELKLDYINVIETPVKAGTPVGEANVCTDQIYNYGIDEVAYAADYEWEIDPASAGTLIPNANSAQIEVASDWTGDFTLKVRATNMCGDGEWSDNLEGTVSQSPSIYNVEGGGSYCLDGDGVEITLDGSETGIDYELYVDEIATGNIVTGTGSEISFGMITEEGYYTAIGSNANCEISMDNEAQVEILFPPLEPATPTGPEVICNEATADYVSTGSDDADSYAWEISPEDAGTIAGNGLEATVTWNAEFTGTAMISLYGINDCGSGGSSEAIEVSVGAPNPEINGAEMACDWSDEFYQVVENEGSTYTWEVTGGSISEGQGTYMITVSWEGEGSGTVSVNEETTGGCEGSSEVFEVVIDDCTGLNENVLDKLVSVNPNPAKEFTMLKSESRINNVTIIHAGSGVVSINEVDNNQYKLNTSHLDSGIYILKMNTEDGVVVKKLIIQ